MAWQFLAQINLTHEWLTTLPVEGEIFRITHEPLDITAKEYLKAVISPAFKDFKGLDIAEWVFVSGSANPQYKAYLDAFGKVGLKEYGMIIWTSYNNKIGSYLIMNRDGTIFMSGR